MYDGQLRMRKRDNTREGTGEWAVDEFIKGEFASYWFELMQGSYENCKALVNEA